MKLETCGFCKYVTDCDLRVFCVKVVCKLGRMRLLVYRSAKYSVIEASVISWLVCFLSDNILWAIFNILS